MSPFRNGALAVGTAIFASLEFSLSVVTVLLYWTFHAPEIQARERVFHTGHLEALWFRGIRPTMNRTTRICRHTADTQEAIDLFDIVLEPMLNIRLQRTLGQLSVCILMWRLRYFELLALLALVWASALYFPLAVSRSVPSSRS